MNSLDTLMNTLIAGRADLEDAYAGKTKVSATRARKVLAQIRAAAQEARKEVLAISKGEAEATPTVLTAFDQVPCTLEDCDKD